MEITNKMKCKQSVEYLGYTVDAQGLHIPYGMKILHGIKFYGFTVSVITVKFNSVKYYS